MAKLLPYHLPFIGKRRRVLIRRKYRNRWKNRFMTDMTNALGEAYARKKPEYKTISLPWNENDYSWDVDT